jgi:uncharacterized tellurite resistance protein B-like protein
MEKTLVKKINLLMHLAKIDGKYVHAERELLLSILRHRGLDEAYLDQHKTETVDLETVGSLPGRTELFYWILKMIKADNFIHPDEVAYAKTLALKLNFKPTAVDYYADRPLPDLAEFEKEISSI